MHRFDLQDWQWELIGDLFPGNDGKEGGQWKDHRTVINGMFHVLHAGCPWRDLPERYGPWQTVFDRFIRYRRDGTFDRMLKRLRTRLDRLGRIDWDYWCFDGTARQSLWPAERPGEMSGTTRLLPLFARIRTSRPAILAAPGKTQPRSRPNRRWSLPPRSHFDVRQRPARE